MNETLTRRQFVAATTAVAAGWVAAACGGSGVTDARTPVTGKVGGTVVDQSGAPSSVGRIYLLRKSGLNEGQYADVDASGAFDFGDVPVGDYQLRFWGGDLASVPEPVPNPVRITVSETTPVHAQFVVALGADTAGIEIYAGDGFYQVQPFGPVNGTVTVPIGTGVCWYNVGVEAHTVTGGPWKDSGVLQEAANFMWTADTAGNFPYQCRFHGPSMQAMLVVTSV